MSVDIRSSERQRYMNELQVQAREKEIAAGLLKASQPASPKDPPETDKRIRREIANSNERRRMQCINAGFSNLKGLIPQLEGEKLSKAAILQHTTEYISSLVKEKTHLQVQLERTNQLMAECGHERLLSDPYVASSPTPSKRKKRDTESSDEGVGSLSDTSDEGSAELRQENAELRHQLEAERQRISGLEERNRMLEAQLVSYLNAAPPPPQQHTIRELQPVKVEATYPPQMNTDSWALYNRDVIEVVGNAEGHPPQSVAPMESDNHSVPSTKTYLPPTRPLSPTPERGLAMEMSLPECPRYLDMPLNPPAHPATQVTASKLEELERPPFVLTPAVTPLPPAAPTPPAVSMAVSVAPQQSAPPAPQPASEVSSPHHHNYCHRDHPRRRLRKKAQLEQQRAEEEEARRLQQQQQLEQQQALAASTAAMAYRPKPPAQNLENLVEAIRQIEGDRMLCQMEGDRGVCDERRMYEEECLYNQRKSITSAAEDSERETTSVSDQEELRGELPMSGGESPSGQHASSYHLARHGPLPPTCHTMPAHSLSSSSPSPSLLSSGSSFSEKYPIASQLLHRPLHQHSMFRPGVIVHKQ